ncbi:MAG TPA: hypothetical protein DCY13_09565 [Verrucomicrobiales bacterium]|nr:hypothetical protein [Verrucomicrobiales bacterium]
MNPDLDLLAQRIAGALFNGVYQGLLLAGVLWLALRLGRRLNAATRHAAGFITLLLIATLPVAHLTADLLASRESQAESITGVLPARTYLTPTVANTTAPGAEAAFPVPEPASETVVNTEELPQQDVLPDETALMLALLEDRQRLTTIHAALLEPDRTPAQNITPTHTPRHEETSLFDTEPITEAEAIANEHAPAPAAGLRARLTEARALRAAVPSIALAIALGAVILIAFARLARLLWQYGQLARLKNVGTLPESKVQEMFDRLRIELGIDRDVRLRLNENVSTPMAIGFRRAVVLLPRSLPEAATPAELEAVLRHELAHVQRRDDWSNLVQQLVAAALFFQPAVWWLSRRLTIEREVACDDYALAGAPSHRDYALFLTEFAGRSRSQSWLAAPAAWSSNSQLKERINMILDAKRNTSLRLARTSVGALTLATVATAAVTLLAAPRLVFASPADSTAVDITTEPTNPSALDPFSEDFARDSSQSPQGEVLFTAEAAADAFGSPAPREKSPGTTPARAPLAPPPVAAPVPSIAPTPNWKVNPTAKPTPSLVPRVAAAPPRIHFPDAAAKLEWRNPDPTREPTKLQLAQAEPAQADVLVREPRRRSAADMEARLERLERLIERLADDKELRHEDADVEWHGEEPRPKDRKRSTSFFDPAGEITHEDDVFGFVHPEQTTSAKTTHGDHRLIVEKAMKDAERDVTIALREAERATRRANEQVARESRSGRASEDSLAIHRRVLEEQRRALADQLRQLDEQLEKLNRKFSTTHDLTVESPLNKSGNPDLPQSGN